MTEVAPSLDLVSNAANPTDSAQKNDLLQQLDQLLERYLHTLDAYQQARTALSEQLSSGFLSLAQANFHNSSSAIRYGRDCYDDRMQAIRNVHVSEVLDDSARSGRAQFSISPVEEVEMKDTEEEGKEEGEEAKEAPESEKQKASSGSVKPLDPLRWFGILVPPALRTAQATFITAVEGPVARVATLAMDLRCQEVEIGRVRKQIKKL